ncbi:hypothetical protein KPL70_008759 [Citrus sinensis]|nr:hypothetical protein KPL70_008759 [Citrus sinensis]
MMSASDLCATEDTVLLLLDYLVDPLLPARPSSRDTPSESLQRSVAKQVHAVVLLYNYYHIKQHRQLKFEGFESFSKLAVVLKPTLLAHMKLLQRSNDSELDDPDKQLSVTEKKIMDACDISNSLDASKDIPSTEGWPISKVAVLLIDSRKENCFLKHSSMTEGVFSLIEKDLDVSSCISEVMSEGKQKRKKIKVTRKFFEDAVDEDTLQQVAFSAVKEATDGKGINQNELIIIRSDVAYSLSKEKTMARFYIMQCKESKSDDVFEIPIRDAIDSLQGPLVTKSSGKWTVTQVVDYFHLLPCAGIMSDWLSREVLSNSSKDHQSASGRINVTNSKRTEEPHEPVIHDNQEGSHVESYIEKFTGSSANTSTKSPMQTNKKRLQTNKNGCSINGLSGDCDGPCSVNVDAPPNEEMGNNTDTTVQVDDHQKTMMSSLKSDLNGTAGSNTKVEIAGSMRMPCISECKGENSPNLKATSDMIRSDEYEKRIAAFYCDPTIDGNRVNPELVRTLQQRNLEDDIALYDKRIQTILNGGDDDLGLKIESLEEDSNGIRQGSLTHERICQQFGNQSSSQSIEMKRLSEAVLELDGICNQNNWILPTYRVSPSDGGFQAHVTMKGIDFECSNAGDPRLNPHEARESAASLMLAKLRRMASQIQ